MCAHSQSVFKRIFAIYRTLLMSFHNPFDLYSDSRSHAAAGPSRNARLQKATLPGSGFISKGEDGRIAVAGRECERLFHRHHQHHQPRTSNTDLILVSQALKILRVLEAPQSTTVDPKHTTRPAFKIESTKNLWEGSNLKIDCTSTDVAWAYGGTRSTHSLLFKRPQFS